MRVLYWHYMEEPREHLKYHPSREQHMSPLPLFFFVLVLHITLEGIKIFRAFQLRPRNWMETQYRRAIFNFEKDEKKKIPTLDIYLYRFIFSIVSAGEWGRLDWEDSEEGKKKKCGKAKNCEGGTSVSVIFSCVTRPRKRHQRLTLCFLRSQRGFSLLSYTNFG